MNYLSRNIGFVSCFLLFFCLSVTTVNAQEVGLCEGINYISKSIDKKKALEDLDDYGKLKMGFKSSYGDHPFRKEGSYFATDENRGRYTLMQYPETDAEAKKMFKTYYDKLKECYGAAKEDQSDSNGLAGIFESKGMHIDVMLLMMKNMYDATKMDYSIYVRFYKLKD
jgi:hypothetical protein